LILLDFPKKACALCRGIVAMRFHAGRVVGASRCVARAVRVERRNKFGPARAAPTNDGFGEPILRAKSTFLKAHGFRNNFICRHE